jgi:putative acetyltransferase
MIVQTEDAEDAAEIFGVHRACFPTDGEARLVDALRASGQLSLSLVAEVDGEVVGHVAFSPVTLAVGEAGVGLGPVAVLEEYRREGYAARLIESGLAECRAAGFGWAVVLGDPAYYSRFGFRPAREFGLTDEFQGGDAFQAFELVAGELPIGAGLVRYAPQFSAFV